jgi:hypothetical protein
MCNHRLHPSSPLEHYDRGARAVGLRLILTKVFISLDWVVVGIGWDLLT